LNRCTTNRDHLSIAPAGGAPWHERGAFVVHGMDEVILTEGDRQILLAGLCVARFEDRVLIDG
jgi:hypothetical protein